MSFGSTHSVRWDRSTPPWSTGSVAGCALSTAGTAAGGTKTSPRAPDGRPCGRRPSAQPPPRSSCRDLPPPRSSLTEAKRSGACALSDSSLRGPGSYNRAGVDADPRQASDVIASGPPLRGQRPLVGPETRLTRTFGHAFTASRLPWWAGSLRLYAWSASRSSETYTQWLGMADPARAGDRSSGLRGDLQAGDRPGRMVARRLFGCAAIRQAS